MPDNRGGEAVLEFGGACFLASVPSSRQEQEEEDCVGCFSKPV